MGRPKLLLPWGGTTVLGHLVQQWRDLGTGEIAVVISDDSELLPELDRLAISERIINPAPDRGMFSSIQCAAHWPHWKTAATHWILTLGDQPHLRPSTLKKLLQSVSQEPDAVWQPARAGRLRHPVALPKVVFERLRNTNASDLKSFLSSITERRRGVEIDDPGLDLDIDIPADYQAALRLAGLA